MAVLPPSSKSSPIFENMLRFFIRLRLVLERDLRFWNHL
jgi:hypothetical protein